METGYRVLQERSSITGAMAWMFVLSFVLTLLLGWVPVIGPFIGPVVGGYVGGRRAGSAGRAAVAAVLPAILLSLLIVCLGALAGAMVGLPILGAAATIVAGALGTILLMHNVVLFVSALAGGWSRPGQTA
jgi:hypothetical protein